MNDARGIAILADIGATNARFGVLAGELPTAMTTYPVTDYESPVEAARAFLAGPAREHKPDVALIAAAGPVVNGRVVMTNAAWTVDADRIRHGLNLRKVDVINDFEALGWALPGLQAADLVHLGKAVSSRPGTMAVMGPGSGFGLAALASNGGAEVVLTTEAGHVTLPAENRREDTIILALRKHLQHVSVERVLSGPGLVQLYHAIAEVDDLVVPQRSAAEIVAHALAGDCKVSGATLEAFCAFLGSVAGNAALTLGARGGVFFGGGILPRIIDFLKHSAFRERFEAKGRLASYLEQIPTAVIVHPYPAFVGLTRLLRTTKG